MKFDGRKDFLPLREKVNSDFCGYFSLFPIVAAYLAIRRQIYPIYREYLFLTINFKEIFENINIFYPSLYETPLPFFNYIIIKEISGFFLFILDIFYVTGIWPKQNHQASVK